MATLTPEKEKSLRQSEQRFAVYHHREQQRHRERVALASPVTRWMSVRLSDLFAALRVARRRRAR